MNNKEASSKLGVTIAELCAIHKEHVNDKECWVKKIKVSNSDNGYYQRSEWQFTNEYYEEVLVPKFKPNLVENKGSSENGVSVFIMDIYRKFRAGIRIQSVKPEVNDQGILMYLYEDITNGEKFWSFEEGV